MSSSSLLNSKQVAEWLNVSQRTVVYLAQAYIDAGGMDGGIPAIKVGRAWRFQRQDIETFLSRTTEATVSSAIPKTLSGLPR
jgi:excisionase family DNA binding protein